MNMNIPHLCQFAWSLFGLDTAASRDEFDSVCFKHDRDAMVGLLQRMWDVYADEFAERLQDHRWAQLCAIASSMVTLCDMQYDVALHFMSVDQLSRALVMRIKSSNGIELVQPDNDDIPIDSVDDWRVTGRECEEWSQMIFGLRDLCRKEVFLQLVVELTGLPTNKSVYRQLIECFHWLHDHIMVDCHGHFEWDVFPDLRERFSHDEYDSIENYHHVIDLLFEDGPLTLGPVAEELVDLLSENEVDVLCSD
jgi:hypothetical protein